MSEASVTLFSKLMSKDKEIADLHQRHLQLQEDKSAVEFMLHKASEEIRRLTAIADANISNVSSTPISKTTTNAEKLERSIWNAYSVIQHLSSSLEDNQKCLDAWKAKYKKKKVETKDLQTKLQQTDQYILALSNDVKQKQLDLEQLENKLNEHQTQSANELQQALEQSAQRETKLKLEKDSEVKNLQDLLDKAQSEIKAQQSEQHRQVAFLRIENLKLKTVMDKSATSSCGVSPVNSKQRNIMLSDYSVSGVASGVAGYSTRHNSLTPLASLNDTIPKTQPQIDRPASRIQHQNNRQNGNQRGKQCYSSSSGNVFSTIDGDSNETLVRSISWCSGKQKQLQQLQQRGGGGELNNTIDYVGDRQQQPQQIQQQWIQSRRQSCHSTVGGECFDGCYTNNNELLSVKQIIDEIDNMNIANPRDVQRMLVQLADSITLSGEMYESRAVSDIIRRVAILMRGQQEILRQQLSKNSSSVGRLGMVEEREQESQHMNINSLNNSIENQQKVSNRQQRHQSFQQSQQAKLPPQVSFGVANEWNSVSSDQFKMQLHKKYQLKVKELEAILVWIASQLVEGEENGKSSTAARLDRLMPRLYESNSNLKPFLDDVLFKINTLKQRNAALINEQAKILLSHKHIKSLR